MLERNHLVFVLEPVRQQLTSQTNSSGGKLVQRADFIRKRWTTRLYYLVVDNGFAPNAPGKPITN